MESHAEQDITLVLMDKGIYDLSDGSGKCAAVVGMKDCLKESGIMNSTPTNAGGWDASERRQWCNNDFPNAFPPTLKALFKQFKTIAANGAEDTATTSTDMFALPAETEIFGKATYASSVAEASLHQFEWYKTKSHRRKKINGVAGTHWGRSAFVGRPRAFVRTESSGDIGLNDANGSEGLSPFCCI